MTKRVVLWAVGIAAFLVVLVGAVSASGLRFYTVMTPSMGQAAPVGTLVVTRPALNYQAGEIVTYERDRRSYTHRIIEAKPDGTFVTKGDLNGAADPLPVTKVQITGQAVWIVPGLGWLWQGVPWLTLGGLLVYALSLFGWFPGPWRWVVRISGWTLVTCLVAIWLRPWVSLTMLSWTASGVGAEMHVVNTGLFPLDVLGQRLVSGQDAVAHVTQQNDQGEFFLLPGLAFYWWEQVLLFLACLVPLGLSLLIGDSRSIEPMRAVLEVSADSDADAMGSYEAPVPTTATPEHRAGKRRLILIGSISLAVIASVAVITVTTTHSALTARVANPTNTTGTRSFFTCTNAVTNSGGGPYLAWAMGRRTTTTETDLTGQGRTGTYRSSTAINTSTATVGCDRDTPRASVYFGGTQCLYTGTSLGVAPQTFSLEAWFWSSTRPNGKIIGFGNTQSGTDSTYDRHVYLDNAGRVVFGTYNGGFQTVSSPSGTNYADGAWHNVIATFSAATGMRLYLDGALSSSNAAYTVAEATAGYWKVGCGNLTDWPNAAGTTTWGALTNFRGQAQFAAVYSTVLTAGQVTNHYLAGLA